LVGVGINVEIGVEVGVKVDVGIGVEVGVNVDVGLMSKRLRHRNSGSGWSAVTARRRPAGRLIKLMR